MASVKTQTASGRTERKCGRIGCGRTILKGEKYYIYSFRYGGKHFRCLEHYPERSELTQSRMSDVYAAIEDFESNFANGADSIQEIIDSVEEVTNAAEEVCEAYREAAEHFGGQGDNAERADELESWISELQNFSPEEFDEETIGAELFQEMFGVDEFSELDSDQRMEWTAELQNKRDEWEDEHEDERQEKINDALEEARQLMDASSL